MKAVTITCPSRAATELPRTISQLALAGLYPTVTVSRCDPAGPSDNRHAAWRALRWASGPVLFTEDDIDVNAPLLHRFLSFVEATTVPVTLTCFRPALYPDGFDPDDPTPRVVELVNTQARRGFYGTQAIVLPQSTIERMLVRRLDFVTLDEKPKPAEHGFDFWLKEHEPRILMAYPNPVQHRAPPKLRPGRASLVGEASPHRSPSYKLGVQHYG